MPSRMKSLEKALKMLEAALQCLDDAEAPADIGAHVDTARVRLSDHLRRPGLAEAGWPWAAQGSDLAH